MSGIHLRYFRRQSSRVLIKPLLEFRREQVYVKMGFTKILHISVLLDALMDFLFPMKLCSHRAKRLS